MKRYLFLLSAPLLAAFSCKPVQVQVPRSFGTPGVLCTITDSRVNESSGIAASYLSKDIYYTHNDSGDTARFFKFDKSGAVLATYSLQGAGAVDWEDMESAKVHGQSYLYLADIGDNSEKRTSVHVYRVKEPTSGSGQVNLTTFDDYEITYPDKAHNAEAFLVNPANGDMFIVTKIQGASSVFKIAAPTASGKYTAAKLGTVTVGGSLSFAKLVTGGSCAGDGKHVVLRTYLAASEFSVPSNFDDWFKQTPADVKTNTETQGEAICYSADRKSFLTTTEGSPCPVSIIPIRGL